MPKSFLELPPPEQAVRGSATFVSPDYNIATMDSLNEGHETFFNLSEQLPKKKKSSNIKKIIQHCRGTHFILNTRSLVQSKGFTK
jgi:hypothetical protein